MQFDHFRPQYAKEGAHKQDNDTTTTDVGNYSTVQHKVTTKKYMNKKYNLGAEPKLNTKKKHKISSRNGYISSGKPTSSRKPLGSSFLSLERKNSVSSRKKPILKSHNLHKVAPHVSTAGKPIHTARVNLTQMSQSPSRFDIPSQKVVSIPNKYGYLGQYRNESHHVRMNSQRNANSSLKMLSSQRLAHSSSQKKLNSSRTEK